MKKIFISGITGTLGQAVSKKLLAKGGYQIIGYSRDELKQSQIEPHENLILYLGDVRDRERLLEATRNVDLIFHFAAYKRIEQGQKHGEEFLKTNTWGTNNILHCQRMNRIPRVVLSSTDKACKPINLYGASKLAAEFLVMENQNNVVVRYGNVLASRGSVIPLFVKSIQEKGLVEITDDRMTRFFIQIEDAADFVIKSAFEKYGGLKIFNMKALSIIEMAYAVSELLGVKKPIIKTIGMRPCEKIHEDLCHEFERSEAINSDTCQRYSRDEILAILSPIVSSLKKNKPFLSKFQEMAQELSQ